ncbi:MAG: isoleucine--tRNA ligase [Bacteroidia bacterium]|nr:isoleucine--tRNA ligase [Bacteroidia bacterium]MDW8158709.1 isoleucine--tRNA ligase [Bacteroidia bacterium]
MDTNKTATVILYPQYKELNYPAYEAQVAKYWKEHGIFEQSLRLRQNAPIFSFYEGPPSANGTPGLHHVLSRTIKDIFCRYKTMCGYYVPRKAGWDTHGLPVELQVEKALGITKADIGTKISIEEYNEACRKDVMKYKDQWDELTELMGYWLDLQNPYITFDNNYIESVWFLLKKLYDKGYLYKGYTIQPYSPGAGTGLSSHELNLPGCYRLVKDISCVAQFKRVDAEEYFLAWTTTPWTLPSNAALAVDEKIIYAKVKTFNRYTHQPITVILAKDRIPAYFDPEGQNMPLEEYQPGSKIIPWQILEEVSGKELVGLKYRQLLPYVQPEAEAFRVISGDFVSTEEGTGIVHIAPTFGADDYRVALQNNIPAITVKDAEGKPMPLVDREGKFVAQVTDFAHRYVKNYTNDPNFRPVDEDIVAKLKQENKAFRIEKYEHNYPHCWRTDKPILYYPLDSWFIKTSAVRERLVELNKKINWKPEATGTKRFGNWLENLVDWNLSRSRYWGIPLPIWRSSKEEKCIGSIAELKAEIARAIELGLMNEDPLAQKFDLHRPYVDNIILADSTGEPMYREPDLIDVWFDSGAMPFAQWHYPFENQELFHKHFPADFIAEGVDQTRGWFFTLHVIAVLTEDNIAYKNVIANGLLLDKDGQKMSKRLGNVIDPFETLRTYGADCTRWYMIENAPPWENLRFNLQNLIETQKKFFGTLFNTYNFFALYASIDHFIPNDYKKIPVSERPEIDRWIIALLQTLIEEVKSAYDDYDATRAARAIQYFTVEELSNWYVRQCRRRFWKGEMTEDKLSAYQTLIECLTVVLQLMAPIAPFLSDFLYRAITGDVSVHLTDFPQSSPEWIDRALLNKMRLAQQICSLVHSIRKRVKIKSRQPLQKILLPIESSEQQADILAMANVIKNEINVKEIEFVQGEVIVKKIKPNYKELGPRLGSKMKMVATQIEQLSQEEIRIFEKKGKHILKVGEGEEFTLNLEDVEITSMDIPGWAVASDKGLTVALDITLTQELREEGLARDLVNRIQNLRKELGFEVTDHIHVKIKELKAWDKAFLNNKAYICNEILADSFEIVAAIEDVNSKEIEIDGNTSRIQITKAG